MILLGGNLPFCWNTCRNSFILLTWKLQTFQKHGCERKQLACMEITCITGAIFSRFSDERRPSAKQARSAGQAQWGKAQKKLFPWKRQLNSPNTRQVILKLYLFLTYNFRKTRSFLGSSLNIDSLREHSVFSTLVSPAEKNRRPKIRLRFAG